METVTWSLSSPPPWKQQYWRRSHYTMKSPRDDFLPPASDSFLTRRAWGLKSGYSLEMNMVWPRKPEDHEPKGIMPISFFAEVADSFQIRGMMSNLKISPPWNSSNFLAGCINPRHSSLNKFREKSPRLRATTPQLHCATTDSLPRN